MYVFSTSSWPALMSEGGWSSFDPAGPTNETSTKFGSLTSSRLNPKSWNYKRQAYALTSEKDYGTTFRDEVQKIGGSKVYYPPPELPGEKK